MLLLAVTISHSKWHIGYKKKTSIQNTKLPSFTPSPTPHLFEITEKIEITLPEKWWVIPKSGIFSKSGVTDWEGKGSQVRDKFNTLTNYTHRSNLNLNSQQKPA